MNWRFVSLVFGLILASRSPCIAQWTAAMESDRVRVAWAGKPIADYVFEDPKIFRPYLAQVRSRGGLQITRNHPPQFHDADDHAEMHPGIWLGFGDISGVDFWRNRGSIVHRQFLEDPKAANQELHFVTQSDLVAPDQQVLGKMVLRMTFMLHDADWIVICDATFTAGQARMIWGDQEEMGMGVRLATPLIERNGGQITNTSGLRTASATWGQPADWSDYSGSLAMHPVGITLMASPKNFRTSWWHNRDYGLMVANPFGRAAMKQGEPSEVIIDPGKSLQLVFAAAVHEGPGYQPQKAFDAFARVVNATR